MSAPIIAPRAYPTTGSTAVASFINRKLFVESGANTSSDGESLYLHGNKIAWHCEDGSTAMTMAGWPSQLTRARLNLLCQMMFDTAPFRQTKGVHYYLNTPITATQVIRVKKLELIDPDDFFK